MNLKERRINAGLTMQELSDILGCNRQQIYNYESGVAPVPIKYIRALAKVLKIKEEELIERLVISYRERILATIQKR